MTGPFGAVRHQTVGDLAYRALRQAILAGRLRSGEHLVQADLAKQLGASRIPVRDALRRLELDGLVASNARGSFHVTPFDAEDATEVYALRENLEPFAASLAVPNLTEDQIDRLAALTHGLEDAANAADAQRYVDMNRKFHFTLYEQSRMPRLVRIISTLWSGRPPLTPLQLEDQITQSVSEHIALLEVIERRDVERTTALLRMHIRRSGDQLVNLLNRAADGGA